METRSGNDVEAMGSSKDVLMMRKEMAPKAMGQ